MEEGQEPVNLTGGPLAYKYQFQEMFFHWGEKVRMWYWFLFRYILLSFLLEVHENNDFNRVVRRGKVRMWHCFDHKKRFHLLKVHEKIDFNRVVTAQNTQLRIMLSQQNCRYHYQQRHEYHICFCCSCIDFFGNFLRWEQDKHSTKITGDNTAYTLHMFCMRKLK